MMRACWQSRLRLPILLTLLLPALPAAATQLEPNGLVVPQPSSSGEPDLDVFFASQGEGIDWQADALLEPATFQPTAQMVISFVLHEADNPAGLAWYNAGGLNAPEPADLHTLLETGAPLEAYVLGHDILQDPAYAGGQIGFAQLGSQTHFTERQWNPVCIACNDPGPWILALIYVSTCFPCSRR